MEIRYMIDDHPLTETFKKVSNINEIVVDGRSDYEIYVDDNDYFILLSDCIELIDENGNVYKSYSDILEVLKWNYMNSII